MTVKMFVGPVKSGKTTKLYSEITKWLLGSEKKIYVFDFLNTRNLDRDLKNLIERCLNQYKERIEFKTDYNLELGNLRDSALIFDEIHFLDVFGTRDQKCEFTALTRKIKETKNVDVIFSGIYYDYYNNFNIFPVWEHLNTLFPSSSTDETNCKLFFSSFQPCFCKSTLDVFYSISIDDRQERVGDHYESICHNCAMKMLTERD